MTTETKTVEIIASNTGRGQYDMRCSERLVKRGDKHYLVMDDYCGEGQMRGGAYRPFVYKVPAEMVGKIANLIANPDEYDEANYDAGSNMMQLRRDVAIELVDRGCSLGEQRPTGWMSEL